MAAHSEARQASIVQPLAHVEEQEGAPLGRVDAEALGGAPALLAIRRPHRAEPRGIPWRGLCRNDIGQRAAKPGDTERPARAAHASERRETGGLEFRHRDLVHAMSVPWSKTMV